MHPPFINKRKFCSAYHHLGCHNTMQDPALSPLHLKYIAVQEPSPGNVSLGYNVLR